VGSRDAETFKAPPSEQATELWAKAAGQATKDTAADQAKFDGSLQPLPVLLDGTRGAAPPMLGSRHAATPRGAAPPMVNALDVAVLHTQTKAALKQLGWKPGVAQAAVAAAATALGEDTTLERLIVEALRRCPQRQRMTPPAPHHDDERSTT
jgi:hypothetical protein